MFMDLADTNFRELFAKPELLQENYASTCV